MHPSVDSLSALAHSRSSRSNQRRAARMALFWVASWQWPQGFIAARASSRRASRSVAPEDPAHAGGASRRSRSAILGERMTAPERSAAVARRQRGRTWGKPGAVNRPPEQRPERRRRRRPRAGRERRPPGVLLKEFWNVPNLLTIGRILVIPLFIYLAYQASPLASLLAGALFAVAAITDVVDGWLARRMGLVTVIGKFLDPLADKLIVLAAMVMLVRLGRFPEIGRAHV